MQWLNPPIEVDVIDATGKIVWAFIDQGPAPDMTTFMTDMARHSEVRRRRSQLGKAARLCGARAHNGVPDATTTARCAGGPYSATVA